MPISLESAGTVALITIDEPATRNALTGDSARDLVRCLDEVAAEPGTGALVIRGAEGQFCSGGDRRLLAAARQRPWDPGITAALSAVYESFGKLASMPVPTIAAIRGAAVGAGLNLALAADVRIAARDARLLSGFLRIGLHPGGGHFTLLDRVAGPQTAVAMTLLGAEVTGQRLVELGLAWEVLDDDQVEPRAMELASRISDPELAREATATFRAQAVSRQLPAATAMRAEQAAQMWSFARQPAR
ncbi:MAG: enoyl-CoA hydratase/isomerase family protein [Nocardiopsaceae bacterium]|nr:enoyl-CoA hydratase/isomerase family protein [Nocardiopsaceae bacterium]